MDILKRDENTCQICFSKEKVHVHHIDKNRKNNNYKNLITLCYECHRKIHANLM